MIDEMKINSVTKTMGVNILAMTGDILFTSCGLFKTKKVPTTGTAARPKITMYWK
jgi:hypothetical protein